MDLDLAYGRRVYNWWGRHRGVYALFIATVLLGRERALRRRAVGALELGAGDTVLDLACGPGVNFSLLEAAIGSRGRLQGIDYSGEMLAAARSVAQDAGWRNAELTQSDAANLDLPDESLDGALCTMALSAIPDHEAAIRNVHAALKPGARLAVLDARPLQGAARVFNPLIRPLFHYMTNWDPDKDVVGCMHSVFGSVELETFGAGSIYVAASEKR